MTAVTPRSRPHPLTWLSLVFAALGAVCYFLWWLLWLNDPLGFAGFGCFLVGFILAFVKGTRPRGKGGRYLCLVVNGVGLLGIWVLPLTILQVSANYRLRTRNNLH